MAVAIVLRKKQDLKLVHWAARLSYGPQVEIVFDLGTAATWRREDNAHSRYHRSAPKELVSHCNDLVETGFYFDAEKKEEAGKGREVGVADKSEAIVPVEYKCELPLEIITIQSQHLERDIANQLEPIKLSCLVLPREYPGDESHWQEHLLNRVSCQTILLTPGSRESGNCRRIVSPVGEGPNGASCLRVAHDLVASANSKLVALHVTPEIDETAKQAAVKTLSKSVDRALGDHQTECVDVHVELSNNVIDGIKQTITDKTDLIILGIKRVGLSKRFSATGLAEKLIQAQPGPSIAVVQSALPIASRLGSKIDELLRGVVPQLPRDQRIELVRRIQSSSEWDFDFILLICLSTIIAAGGLLQNSAAVVIGAMLVAPLMTPLLGSGLAIVQGNWVLFKNTLFTVGRGFVLALLIGFLVAFLGNVLIGVSLTEQMRQRGNPSALDIAVAMVGGIAAAYASGRPNLLSALPGVAIAAALVPPIATSGISIYMGEFGLAFRSALLFVTNIVAIILGTAFAFRATGIRSQHKFGTLSRWTIPAASFLLLAAISLGLYESFPTHQNSGFALLERINLLVEKHENWECLSAEHRSFDGEEVLTLRFKTVSPVSESTLDRIHAEVKRVYETRAQLRILVEKDASAESQRAD